MRKFIICNTKYYYDHKIWEDGMDRTYSTQGSEGRKSTYNVLAIKPEGKEITRNSIYKWMGG
jgi:hypothetical protein